MMFLILRKGLIKESGLGPTRVTQAGLLTAREVKRGMWVVFGVTALLGSYLVFIGGWVFLLVGLAAIISAIAYTGGPVSAWLPWVWGYLCVFIFWFGCHCRILLLTGWRNSDVCLGDGCCAGFSDRSYPGCQ